MALTPLEKLTNQRSRLLTAIKREEEKETDRFSKLGWGYGMRHSKLPNDSVRLADLEHRLGKINKQLGSLA